MKAHEIVDGALTERAVVVGSLPPGGRDLDVLLSPCDVAAVERALRAAGFCAHGAGWLRFANLTAEIVELVGADDLGLDAPSERELVETATTLPGARRLAQPAPCQLVLMLARKAHAEGGLSAPRRRRLAAVLAEAPGALGQARAHATAWGMDAGLAGLCRPAPARRRRRGGLLPAGAHARLGAARDALRGRRRGAVIALSGLDGSGKSTQAAALSEALERLGCDVAVEWTRLGFNDRFWERAARIKRVLNRVAAAAAPRGERTAGDERPADGDRLGGLRRRSRLLTQLWAIAITVDYVLAQRRVVGGFLARDHVVICDRYTLDSIVSLRSLLGDDASFGLQRVLLRVLTRRPRCAYLLDVTPETAWARKGEHGLAPLRRHRALYLAEHRPLGVVKLDAEAPPAELAARIARDCWTSLQGGALGSDA